MDVPSALPSSRAADTFGAVRAALLLIVATASLVLAAPAQATPQWLQPVTVAGPLADPARGDIAVAPNGTMLEVSQQRVGTADHIRARLRRPGGGFGPTIELATANGDSTTVAVDQLGNFTAVWKIGNDVKAARLAAGASAFEQTQTIGTIDAFNDPVLAVGGNGTGVIALRQGSKIVAALRNGPSGQFSPLSIPLSGTLAIADTFSVAADDLGNAIIVWSREDPSGKTFVEASERAPGSGFGAIRPLSLNPNPGDTATGPVVAMAPNGRGIVLWTFDTSSTQPRVQDIERKPNGTWLPAPEFASRDGDTAGSPHIAMAGDGTAIAVWSVDVATIFLPQAAVRRPDQTFQILQPNLSSAGFGALDIAVTRAGTATVAWSGAMSETITARRRPPGGAFGNADTVAVGTQGSASPAISVNVQALGTDNQSNATLLYQRDVVGSGHNEHSLLTASFDAAAPTLASVAVPATGVPGAGVGMAAAATDRLSVPAIRWSFGDGTSAAGPAVTHTYVNPGAYSVTVSATDGAGNASTVTRSIVIAPNVPPETPRVRADVKATWAFNRLHTWIVGMKVKPVRRGKRFKAEVRCTGRRCPFKLVRSKRVRHRSIVLFKKIPTTRATTKRKRTLNPGTQRLEVRITRPGFIGKVVRFKIVRNDVPTTRTLCIPIGKTKPRRKC
jgi:hypothetical protein